MNKRILVTYASRGGATRGVAEAIAQSLASCGASVEVLPVHEVQTVAGYDAVVAGSAIQAGAWLPEAMQFLRCQQAELQGKRFAAFLVCMTLAMRGAEQYRPGVSEWMAPVRALVKPLSEGLFAGAMDISKVQSPGDRLKFRIASALGFWPEGDHRDWQAIRAWACSLAPLLSRQA